MSSMSTYKKAQQIHKEKQLKNIEETLLEQVKNGDLPAIVKTSEDIAGLLKKKGWFKKYQSPEREQLSAALAAHGIPKEKVSIGVCGDFTSWVKINP